MCEVGTILFSAYTIGQQRFWGSLLKELPIIRVLAHGWFALRFHREEYTDWILSRFWHIKMALVLLKQWDPLFDP